MDGKAKLHDIQIIIQNGRAVLSGSVEVEGTLYPFENYSISLPDLPGENDVINLS